MNIKEELKQELEYKTPEPPSLGTRLKRTVFGLIVAGGAGVLLFYKAIPPWMGFVLVLFGGFFISKSLTVAFAKTILEPIVGVLSKLK